MFSSDFRHKTWSSLKLFQKNRDETCNILSIFLEKCETIIKHHEEHMLKHNFGGQRGAKECNGTRKRPRWIATEFEKWLQNGYWRSLRGTSHYQFRFFSSKGRMQF